MRGDVRFLLILYLNKATEGALFMSFGRSFPTRIVEGNMELENKIVANRNSDTFQHSEGDYMYKNTFGRLISDETQMF